jgi:AcrR family transcriptional regulator
VNTEKNVRDRILKEGMRLFLENGFRGTSVKDLTEAAGVARGTLYCHFKSKDEVLESILDKYSCEFLDQLMATVEACKEGFVIKFKTFFRFTTEFARDNRELLLVYNTLLGEIVGNSSNAEKKIKEMQMRFNLFVENLIAYGQGEGTVPREIDAHAHSHVITATLSGMLLQWYLNEDSIGYNNKKYVRSFRASMLRGLGVVEAHQKNEQE